MKRTPIAIFTYNRPDHVARLLDSLEGNARLGDCDVYIYCDGPKNEVTQEEVLASRKIVRERAGRLNAEVIESPVNLGVDRSVVYGVTALCAKYGSVIVLEDDLVVAPDFLQYMLQALERYRDAPNVYQISGYMFPAKLKTESDAIFLPFTTSWGWATWRRAWEIYDWTCPGFGKFLLNAPKCRQFNLDGAINYSRMLEIVMSEKWGPWDIRFYYAVFMRKGLVLHPNRSLVWNGGFDGSGVHIPNKRYGELVPNHIRCPILHDPVVFPKVIEIESKSYRKLKLIITEICQSPSHGNIWYGRVGRCIKRWLVRLRACVAARSNCPAHGADGFKEPEK